MATDDAVALLKRVRPTTTLRHLARLAYRHGLRVKLDVGPLTEGVMRTTYRARLVDGHYVAARGEAQDG